MGDTKSNVWTDSHNDNLFTERTSKKISKSLDKLGGLAQCHWILKPHGFAVELCGMAVSMKSHGSEARLVEFFF
ncbi:hypothetical protein J5N97_018761 [Dioscorea zingiberensis]|uniref:Uncharacterized protein n=1 Tax=Dioscorea zingiberensis TaxID=325984 RepID=A0A9D5HC23_9LILI|nr:hypothetical protein J5N97_018761 [Dioscorea zingiberensis]